MPFTKEQLKNVDFYQDFVTELQRKYLNRVEELKEQNFRRNDTLYSFEDIISLAEFFCSHSIDGPVLGKETFEKSS